MVNLKRFLTILLFLSVAGFSMKPFATMAVDERITTYDRHAPLYFIQIHLPAKPDLITLHDRSYSKVSESIVQFSPQKPWELIILIEESIWVSSVEQNSVLLNIMDKIPVPPKDVTVFTFNTGVNQIESYWKNPVILQKSTVSDVRLTDAMQKINQMITLKDQNCLLCIIGSGKNTGNIISIPSVFCPVWFFFQDNNFNKHSPYLNTLSSCSGGRIFFYDELENIDRLELPPLIHSQILCFSVPYQWLNFHNKIRLSLQERDIVHSIELKYPIPWFSLLGILLLIAVIIFFLTYFFLYKNEQKKIASKIHHYGLAWLEWIDTFSKKRSKRIQSCEFTIGSNPNCHLSLQDDAISDFHALIEEKNTVFTISDLSSRYGVWINQRKISSQLLHDGDMIQIGNIYLTFRQSHIKYESNEKYL